MDKLSKRYIDEIVEWNKKFNLTGLKTPEDIKAKLYDDSLNISKATGLINPLNMIDIGCGAGFPGIPIKIEFPDIELALVDSVAKKIEFVNHVISMLELKRTSAICARAEELGQDDRYREKYDLCVSRAVAQMNVLCEYCLPFVKTGGLFIAQKGPDIENELKVAASAIKILGGHIKDNIKVDSGFLVVIEKIEYTPAEYPRRVGLPSKRPL